MDTIVRRKIGIIAWERFCYGGISRVVSSLISNMTDSFDVKVLCLKEKKFFQNVYNIDVKEVEFTFTEMTLIQKLRREFANLLMDKGMLFSDFLIKQFPFIKYSSSYLKKISNWINDNEFDFVIFSTGFEDCLQLAAIKPVLKNNPKLIAWSHAGFTDYFRNPKNKKFIQKLWGYYYRRFDTIVVLSDADVLDCKKLLHLDATRIYNPNSFVPTKRTNLCNKRFLYLGALSETKGSDILINAFIEFSKSNQEWGLDLCGEGAISEWIQHQIVENKLQDRVKLYPYTLNIEEVYSTHDVFILPSRYEGFGIVQIEAAGCGLPLIASDVSIARELISKYCHGVLFKRLDSHDLAQQMLMMATLDLSLYSNKAVDMAKDFTVEKIILEWKTLLSKM